MNWGWALAIFLAAVGAAGGYGYQKGWEHRGAHDAQLQAAADEKWEMELKELRQHGDQLAIDLAEEKRNIKTVTVEVIKTVPKVTKVYVEKPGDEPKPIPACVYTTGFVGVWNGALTGSGLPNTSSDTAGAPAGADIARAPIDTPDVLYNAAENFSGYAECRASLNALIDWHEATRSQLRGGGASAGR